jgi:hypothetical protein
MTTHSRCTHTHAPTYRRTLNSAGETTKSLAWHPDKPDTLAVGTFKVVKIFDVNAPSRNNAALQV